jgi:glyceraldehyde-3-phosphate dehydrogenase/erythrose-4-phosphate dehydrogenase
VFIDNYASLGVLQAYMFKYDSVHGKAKQYDVKADAENSLLLGGKPIAVYGLKYVHELWHS